MKISQGRSTLSATALAFFGAISLLTWLPGIAARDAGCAPQVPIVAPLGLHIDLQATIEVCTQHSSLLGVNVEQFAQLLFTLSTCTLIAGTIGLLMAIGLGAWFPHALRALREWLYERLGLPHLTVSNLPPLTRVLPSTYDVIPSRQRPHTPLQRRGPPVVFS